MTLTDAAAADVEQTLRETGFLDEGVDGCAHVDAGEVTGYCIRTLVDGESVFATSLAPGLADAIGSGSFAEDPVFLVTTRNATTARRLRRALVAGA